MVYILFLKVCLTGCSQLHDLIFLFFYIVIVTPGINIDIQLRDIHESVILQHTHSIKNTFPEKQP